MLNSRRMPAAYIASRHSRPIQKLNEEEGVLLEKCLHRIERNIERTEHAWQRDIIMNELIKAINELKKEKNAIILGPQFAVVPVYPIAEQTLPDRTFRLFLCRRVMYYSRISFTHYEKFQWKNSQPMD
jgi:hypothetical protein